MQPVPFIDLKMQYLQIKNDVRKAIDDVLESQQFILGSAVENFERKLAAYVGIKHAIGVASGSDALLLSLMALDIGPGDEVITSPYTFFSTAGAISRLGAKPVFVDIDPTSYNIDTDRIEDAITRQTRAIIPIHLFGLVSDMKPIIDIAQARGLKIVEDAAQALSADYPTDGGWKKAGTLGDMGCYSFFPTKNLGAYGDGGMVVTDDDFLAEKIRTLRVHGAKPKYHHAMIGCNSRLDALQAAVLSAKLPYLDNWSRLRRRNAEVYDALFETQCLIKRGYVQLPNPVYTGAQNTLDHIYNQYVIRTKNRDELRGYLRERGILTEIYYPIPLHLQPCYHSLNYQTGDFPEAEKAAQETLALPIYPELAGEQQAFVVDQIATFFGTESTAFFDEFLFEYRS